MLVEIIKKFKPKPSLIKTLRPYLTERIQEHQWKPRSEFWATDFGYCDRKIAYSMTKPPTDLPDDRSKRIFDSGDDMHRRYVFYMAEAGILRRSEWPRRKEGLSARIDAIVEIDGIKYVVELKTVNSFGFKEIKRDKVPKKEHLIQLLINMKLADIGDGIILYEDKNTQDMFEFVVTNRQIKGSKETIILKPNYGLLGEVFATINRITKLIEAGELPPRQYEKTDWHCRYCSYFTECWEKKEDN